MDVSGESRKTKSRRKNMNRDEFDSEIIRFMEFYKHNFTPQQSAVWFENFQAISAGLFRSALNEHIKKSEYSTFPSIGKITQKVDLLRENYYAEEKRRLGETQWTAQDKCFTPALWRMSMKTVAYHGELLRKKIISDWNILNGHYAEYLSACDRNDAENFMAEYMSKLENKYPFLVSFWEGVLA